MAGRPSKDFDSAVVNLLGKASQQGVKIPQLVHDTFMPLRASRKISGPKYYAALIAFTISQDIESAAILLMNNVPLRMIEAESIILDAVNAAPSIWQKAQQKTFPEKGLIQGLSRWHKAHYLHKKNSRFDTICSQIPPSREPILLASIDAAYMHTNAYGVRPSERALIIIAAQLLENGPEKTEILNTLSKSPGNFTLAMRSALKTIMAVAEPVQIDINSLPLIEDAELNPERLAQKMSRAAHSKAVVEAKNSDPQVSLKKRLAELVAGGAISEFEQDVYLYASLPRADGKLPSNLYIQSKFTKKGGFLAMDKIEDIKRKIPPLLQTYEVQEEKYAAALTPESP